MHKYFHTSDACGKLNLNLIHVLLCTLRTYIHSESSCEALQSMKCNVYNSHFKPWIYVLHWIYVYFFYKSGCSWKLRSFIIDCNVWYNFSRSTVSNLLLWIPCCYKFFIVLLVSFLFYESNHPLENERHKRMKKENYANVIYYFDTFFGTIWWKLTWPEWIFVKISLNSLW